MKELFTRDFWQGVKKTFYEAMEDPPPKDTTLEAPAAADSELPPPPGQSESSETGDKN